MPLRLEIRVIVDPHGRTEGQSAVGAACEHYVRCASSGGEDAAQHVNIVVSRSAGAINRQEQLPAKSCRIDAAAN
jgi:ribulose kinase